jgi:hypothetical protein
MNAISKKLFFCCCGFLLVVISYPWYSTLWVDGARITLTPPVPSPADISNFTTTASAASMASTPPPTGLPDSQAAILTITGWFNTIWNGEPRYTVTDSKGQEYRLLLDESLAKSLGGALQFDRRRVIISGKIVDSSRNVIQVLAIRLATGNG